MIFYFYFSLLAKQFIISKFNKCYIEKSNIIKSKKFANHTEIKINSISET
jgi:hypothetical protein